uniref:Uncharacterized protein n=1 Tax=Physcomitrium patens TaxID=3218 RepID=A0A2K1JLY8_PHYPA|nr:hypothetical protein PHYPA_017394 [Physcomitrium patens]
MATTWFFATLKYVAAIERPSPCSTTKVHILKLLRPEDTVTSRGSLVSCLNSTKRSDEH